MPILNKREYVKEKIENMILEDKYPHGNQLPPEPELAEMLKVSRGTVRLAMSELLISENNRMNLSNLRDQLISHFNKGELRDLCFDLGISYEELPGDTIRDKSRELIDYCNRHGTLQDLTNRCSELRPNAIWTLHLVNRIKKESDFISAYLAFIHPDTLLTTNYSQILSKHYNKICAEVEKLESAKDWETLIEVKRRLREFFEYSGKYLEGVEFGKRYFYALKELGEEEEALWTKVKHVGYLLILAGKHAEGRKEILEVLNKVESNPVLSDSIKELIFYSYRYLGISYQRDTISGDVSKALKYFAKANKIAKSVSENPRLQKELLARILGNQGNIALQQNDFSQALDYFNLSHQMFIELEDTEHIGIANLQIGQTVISSNRMLEKAITYLETAENLFILIGWNEGQGRVCYQYGQFYERLAIKAENSNERQSYLKTSLSYSRKCKAIFEQIEHQKWSSQAEALIERIRDLLNE